MLGLSEICDATGFDKSTAQRFTYTLHALGYLSRDEATRKYMLSAKLLEFGLSYLESDDLVGIATPLLQAANRECHETVNLTRLVDTEVTYVARIVGHHPLSVDILLGSRFPAYLTAPGRAMLSCMPEDRVAAILDASKLVKRTPKTLTSKSALMAEIRKARRQGFTIAVEQIYDGEISAAVPVGGVADPQPAAVNVSVPLSRWTESTVRERLIPILSRLAVAISEAPRVSLRA